VSVVPPALAWLARLLIVLATLAAVALTGLYRAGPPHSAVVELLRYAPFLIYLVPGLLGLALSFALGWTWRLTALAAVALMLTAVMDLSLGRGRAEAAPPGGAATGRTVRVMTYNIKSYRAAFRPGGFGELADEVAQHVPDILMMQDARDVARRGDLPRGMREVLPDHHLHAYGQYAIASRFPLRDCRVGDISHSGETHEYLRCRVDIDGTAVDLVTAHLLTPREGLNATRHEGTSGFDDWQANFAARRDQADQLVRDLAPLRRPTILAGDLNAPEHSIVVRTLLDLGLHDVFSTAGRGWGYTHGHSLKPGVSFLRIDHILASADIGVADARTGWRGASEHRPVIADLWIPKTSPQATAVDKSTPAARTPR
jgi:endonuclease/exonuclease/phosphatase (EEP) superfamily protein YafD